MILVTVGTDLPFDRMIRVIDNWAFYNQQKDVVAQIGNTGWQPKYIQHINMLSSIDFVNYLKSASLVISHAGMGTILTALFYGKPILVMPKKASLGEHRNEHQLATAQRIKKLANVNVAFNTNDLRNKLNNLDVLIHPKKISNLASEILLTEINQFIHMYSNIHY